MAADPSAYDPANPFKASSGGSPYDILRRRATQNAGNSEDQNMDALTRRFAAMGNLNSGAYTQAIADSNRSIQNRNQDAQGQIDLSEAEHAMPYTQLAQQKELAQQQMGQQESQFGRQLGQQQSQFQAELPLKSRQLDLEASQQALDKQANDINASLGNYQAHHSGGLFGGGGTLGLGIGEGGK